MCNKTSFPDLPAWQKLRAELETHQSPKQASLIGYIDLIIQSYDNPTARQTAFEQLIDWLDVTALVDKISLALTLDLSSTSSPEQRAREILLEWLPDRLVTFSIQEVDYKEVMREDGDTAYLQRGVNITKRLNNWLDFPTLVEWQRLQSRLKPYKNNAIDQPLIELVNKAEENYLPIQQFILYIEDISNLMMQQKKMQYILAGRSEDRRTDNAIKTLWAEARLKSWMRTNLIDFKPTGETATKSLQNWVYKYLHERISHDFNNYIRYQSKGAERSLDEPIADGFTLFDTIASPPITDLDQEIAALQQAEKARRGFPFPIFHEFFKGLAKSLEAASQSCWEVRLANYINQDPHEELQKKFHVEKACNYQYLLKFLELSKIQGLPPELQGLPPKTVTDICREFSSIGEHSLRSHISRTFYPWIDSIYLEILTEEEWSEYRSYLENVAEEDLIARYRKGFPTCNIFFLAQHRLPCFLPKPLHWSALAEMISTSDGRGFRPEYVETFWQEECRPHLGKIARQQILEYKAA